MTRLFMAIATGLYIGRLAKAPKILVSLAALPVWLLISNLRPAHYLMVIAVLLVAGFFSAGAAEKILDSPDAEPIVIDEIVGTLIALTLVPHHPVAVAAAVVLFRFFETLKPWPISWITQCLHGGFAIMADDVVAGIYAFCCLQLLGLIAGVIL